MGRGHQAPHINATARREQHAVAVADDHLPSGTDAPRDGAGLRAGDTVEGGTTAVVELHLGICTHIEALPVDGCALAALVDH